MGASPTRPGGRTSRSPTGASPPTDRSTLCAVVCSARGVDGGAGGSGEHPEGGRGAARGFAPNQYAQFIDEVEGLEKIENLQNHNNNDIYDKAREDHGGVLPRARTRRTRTSRPRPPRASQPVRARLSRTAPTGGPRSDFPVADEVSKIARRTISSSTDENFSTPARTALRRSSPAPRDRREPAPTLDEGRDLAFARAKRRPRGRGGETRQGVSFPRSTSSARANPPRPRGDDRSLRRRGSDRGLGRREAIVERTRLAAAPSLSSTPGRTRTPRRAARCGTRPRDVST